MMIHRRSRTSFDTTFTLRAVCLLAALCCALPALARPEYAQRELKTCQYCHLSPTPGLFNATTQITEATTRNERGLYYAAHNHSFAGYVERDVMGIEAPPVFHFAWRETLTDAPRRLGVADVKGDGALRLITLNEKPGDKSASILTVKRWDGKAFVTEFTGQDAVPADRLEVGKYAGPGLPALIVTSDAVWYWNGKTFVSRPLGRSAGLFGSTRLNDGSERVLLASSPADVKAYRIDLSARDGALFTDAQKAPETAQILWGDMHATPEFFDQMGMPKNLAEGGLIGIWDVRRFGKKFVYQAKINRDYDLVKDPDNKNQPKFILRAEKWSVAFLDTSPQDPNKSRRPQLYYTPGLSGVVYDVAVASPKDASKPGLLILTSDSMDGLGRSLYFFPLD